MQECLLIAVAMLGSPDFRTREAVHRHLLRLDGMAMHAVLAGERTGGPETSARCRQIARAYYAKHAAEIVDAMRPKGWECFPAIFHMPEDYPHRDAAIQAWKTSTAPLIPDYADNESWGAKGLFGEATRRLLVSLTEARIDATELLAGMTNRHREWCREQLRMDPERRMAEGMRILP